MLLHNSNLWFCRITCGSVSGERGWVWASCVFREWFCGCSHSHHNMWRTAAGGLLWWWWSSQGIESLSCNLPAQHQTTDRQRQISLADVHSGTFSSKRHRYLSQELLEWAKRRVNIEQTLTLIKRVDANTTPNECWCCSMSAGCEDWQMFAT